MSVLSIAFPFEAAFAFAGVAASAARPLIGISVFATLFLVFKPLIKGLLHAAVLLVSPKKSIEDRRNEDKFKTVKLLHRMAREYDSTQPNLAAEMRQLASRG